MTSQSVTGVAAIRICKGVEICCCCLVVIPIVVQRTATICTIFFLGGLSDLTTTFALLLLFLPAYPSQTWYYGTLRSSSLQPDAKYFANALCQ